MSDEAPATWRNPGRFGATLYGVALAVVGSLTALFSRLQIERQRGRRTVADALPAGALIVVSNHTSYADGVLLAITCRRLGRSLRLLATGGVFRTPLLGRLLRRIGFIPVERHTADARDSLSAAVQALAAGEAVGLYPEGRITRDPALWPERAKTGAVRLALDSGAPIVPVAMVGAQRVVGRRRIALRLLVNTVLRPRVRVRVGQPIDVRELMHIGPTTMPTAGEVRLAADDVMARLVGLVAELRNETMPPAHAGGPPPGDTP